MPRAPLDLDRRRPTRMVLSRRALGGAAAASLLAATGCGVQDHAPGGVVLSPLTAADEGLVRLALRAEQQLLDTAQQVARRVPGARRPLGAAVTVHRRHVQLLIQATGLPRPTPPRPVRAGPPDQALTRLVAAEQRLSKKHADWALTGTSGPLARVLAAMAAAAAQQAEALGDVAAAEGGGR